MTPAPCDSHAPSTATPGVTVRRMRWWDLDDVLAIERVAFDADRPWTAEQFWSELAGVPARRLYLVADDRGSVVGYAGLAWPGDLRSDAATVQAGGIGGGEGADIMTLAVHPDRGGGGIGRALLRALLDAVRARGVAEVMLEVRADNAGARALYRGAGFVDLARRRDYYAPGVDGVVMRWRAR